MPIQFDVSTNDLEKAYQRVKNDRPERCFVDFPSLFDFIDTDRRVLFDELTEKIAKGYQPHTTKMCWVPKPNHQVRPANILHLKDEVVFNLIVGDLYPTLFENIERFREVDIAYPLAQPDKTKWISDSFNAWKNFSNKTLEILEKGCEFVVYSDITGFYENIEIKRLMTFLKEICGERPQIDLLSACLNVWSNRGEAGIPQGYSASDILAKTFASRLDEMLVNDGFSHLRYVDDLRIFCNSKSEAKKAILALSKYVHTLGLNLQSAKTKILTGQEVMDNVRGTTMTIDGIRQELVDELVDEILTYGEYPIVEEAVNTALEKYPEDSLDVLERTFVEHFLNDNDGNFNKSLFHFLLKKLGRVGSKKAIEYCLWSLGERPEETLFVLNYLQSVELENAEMASLITYLVSAENVYDYQRYQILKWFLKNNIKNAQVLQFSRRVIEDLNKDEWLRAYAISYVGRFGNEADLTNFEYQFTQDISPMVKAHFIEACRRRLPAARNAFYRRVAGQDALYKLAVAYSRRG